MEESIISELHKVGDNPGPTVIGEKSLLRYTNRKDLVLSAAVLYRYNYKIWMTYNNKQKLLMMPVLRLARF